MQSMQSWRALMRSGGLRSRQGAIRSPAVPDGRDGERDLGVLWHGLGGAVIGAFAALFGWIAAAGATLALAGAGYAREAIQHDLCLSGRQWLEAIAWPLGGALGAGLSLGAQALL